MKPLDEELKSVLRRVEPPAGFSERVLAQARKEAEGRTGFGQWLSEFFRPRAWRWAAALAFASVIVVLGWVRTREIQRTRLEGERAQAQARLALQIASTKLNAALRDAARPARRNLEN